MKDKKFKKIKPFYIAKSTFQADLGKRVFEICCLLCMTSMFAKKPCDLPSQPPPPRHVVVQQKKEA